MGNFGLPGSDMPHWFVTNFGLICCHPLFDWRPSSRLQSLFQSLNIRIILTIFPFIISHNPSVNLFITGLFFVSPAWPIWWKLKWWFFFLFRWSFFFFGFFCPFRCNNDILIKTNFPATAFLLLSRIVGTGRLWGSNTSLYIFVYFPSECTLAVRQKAFDFIVVVFTVLG